MLEAIASRQLDGSSSWNMHLSHSILPLSSTVDTSTANDTDTVDATSFQNYNDGCIQLGRFGSRLYSGQFNSTGSLFYCASQDFKVRVYAPPSALSLEDYSTMSQTREFGQFSTRSGSPGGGRPSAREFGGLMEGVDELWPLLMETTASVPRWTITDATVDNQSRFLAMTSISPVVDLVRLPPSPNSTSALCKVTIDAGIGAMGDGMFVVWCVRFSPDSSQLSCGTSAGPGRLLTYDISEGIAQPRRIRMIDAHSDDINSIAYQSGGTSNVLLSGSDDSLIKVWDLRSERSECGVLMGHTEGVTHLETNPLVSWQVISNGKDQTMRVWDLRNMMAPLEFQTEFDVEDEVQRDDHVRDMFFARPQRRRKWDRRMWEWDYRFEDYPGPDDPSYLPPVRDLATHVFKGHQVTQTLIRCHFSPESTGCRYAVTGCAGGYAVIYDLQEMKMVRRVCVPGRSVVRDVAWHPFLPRLVTTSWNGMLCLY